MPLEDEINARLRYISREIRRFREELREAQRVPHPRGVERLIAADASERHLENTAPSMKEARSSRDGPPPNDPGH
jgi:hypothetical protein